MVMRSRATNGGVRPNASKKGQIGPSTTVRAARGDGSCPNCASALQGARETASIHGSSGVIWRIPVIHINKLIKIKPPAKSFRCGIGDVQN
jgi:sugar (pentulose or hexulose) kinase